MVDMARRRFLQCGLALILLWSVLVGGLLVWEYHQANRTMMAVATGEARAHFRKDLAFRLWASDYATLYVPVSDLNRPDPYLAHLPERDITTPSGKRLTLINPARMIRQINERYGEFYGVPGRITSLHPLRPENAPDAWERRALQQFRAGRKEVFDLVEDGNGTYLRLMRPIMMGKGCVRCHAAQGYREGDIGGGVGIKLPMNDLLARRHTRLVSSTIGFLMLWLVGLGGIFYAMHKLYRQERRRADAIASMQENEARKGAFLDTSLDGVVSVGVDGRIIDFNLAAEKIFGYRRDEVVGEPMAPLLIPEALREAHNRAFDKHLETGRNALIGRRMETLGMRSDGSEFPLELAVSRVDINGDPVFTAFMRDITDARELAEELAYQASHDSLTGLVNRGEFEKRVNHALSEMDKGDRHTLFYLDLDQFKVVNDTGGHAAGDELLRQLAALIRRHMRGSDLLARLGGDEFGILLRNCSLEHAVETARTLLDTIREYRFTWKDKVFSVGCSIGAVALGYPAMSLAEVLSAADAACYSAKEEGRNRLHVYRTDDEDLAQRKQEMCWISRMHDAFEDGRFFLYHQPIRPLRQDDDTGGRFEILLRMQDEKGAFVSPALFLSAAERYNMMPTIDRWVVRTTFKWLAEHPDRLHGIALCTLNLSGHSVTDSYFLAFIREQIASYGIPPDRLCFEITETALVTNFSKASAFIKELRELGCRFALDDFGSGMSSFGYLKHLPVDFLKIDGEFVRDIHEDEIDLAMVKSINEIGQLLGKQTIAEFVENEEILELLRHIGVDFAQGYHLGRPEPLA